MIKKGKIDNIYKPQNWKKRRRKKNTGKEVYICVCTLNNIWKNMFVKLMMFYCKTLLTPYAENHTQSARLISGANMLDLRSEALAQSKPVTFCSFLVCVMVSTTKSGVCEGIGATCN